MEKTFLRRSAEPGTDPSACIAGQSHPRTMEKVTQAGFIDVGPLAGGEFNIQTKSAVNFPTVQSHNFDACRIEQPIS